MPKWTHDISRHRLEEILSAMEQRGYSENAAASRVLFCDTEGGCYFDEAPDPVESTIRDILNERGQDGWELVQVIFREKEMLSIWRKQTD